MRDLDKIFVALAKSAFRHSFRLRGKELAYLHSKGLPAVLAHAEDFIAKRLVPAVIPNDGKQTPFRGHPVFIAQHATACCCRGCLEKWHRIPQGRELTPGGKGVCRGGSGALAAEGNGGRGQSIKGGTGGRHIACVIHGVEQGGQSVPDCWVHPEKYREQA